MAWMQGARRAPISKNYQAVRTSKTAVILHTAASKAGGANHYRYWNRDPRAKASAHFYVDYSGEIWQLVDTAFVALTSGHANYRSIGVETQGTGDEPWTAQQVTALAKILAWAHATHGVPLTLMRNSNERAGIGFHRLGVPASYRQLARRRSQTGGELWSRQVGKICPGPRREAQIPHVIQLATGGQPATYESEERELNADETKKLTAIYDTLTKGQPGVKFNGEIWERQAKIDKKLDEVLARLARVENEVLYADVLGDPKARGIANALRRMRRWIEPPAGTDPTEPAGAPWNRWIPWRYVFNQTQDSSKEN